MVVQHQHRLVPLLYLGIVILMILQATAWDEQLALTEMENDFRKSCTDSEKRKT